MSLRKLDLNGTYGFEIIDPVKDKKKCTESDTKKHTDPLTVEHTIPVSVVSTCLLNLSESDITEEKLLNIIKAVRGVALVTKKENKLFKNNDRSENLQSSLPKGYTIEKLIDLTENLTAESEQKRNEYYLCRYKTAGIDCSKEYWSPETGIKNPRD
jgi:hypothetical protein